MTYCFLQEDTVKRMEEIKSAMAEDKKRSDDLIVCWMDRSTVLDLMFACMIAKSVKTDDPEKWNKHYDELKAHLFGEVK